MSYPMNTPSAAHYAPLWTDLPLPSQDQAGATAPDGPDDEAIDDAVDDFIVTPGRQRLQGAQRQDGPRERAYGPSSASDWQARNAHAERRFRERMPFGAARAHPGPAFLPNQPCQASQQYQAYPPYQPFQTNQPYQTNQPGLSPKHALMAGAAALALGPLMGGVLGGLGQMFGRGLAFGGGIGPIAALGPFSAMLMGGYGAGGFGPCGGFGGYGGYGGGFLPMPPGPCNFDWGGFNAWTPW